MPMEPPSLRPRPVASTGHTLVVLGILAAITALTARRAGGAAVETGTDSRLPMYAVLIVMEWLLFFGVWRGLKAHGTPLSAVFGERYGTWRGRAVALVSGVAALPVILLATTAVKQGLVYAGADMSADHARVLEAMLPHGIAEGLAWIALSISAGVCEEFAYRGYLLRQFSAWLGAPVPGMLLSALVFGLGHAYQGPWQALLIGAAYGIPLGALALLARGLGPGIVAHALNDALPGLARF